MREWKIPQFMSLSIYWNKSDGATDGVPEKPAGTSIHVYPGFNLIAQEMHRIEIGESRNHPYALTNEAEFLRRSLGIFL